MGMAQALLKKLVVEGLTPEIKSEIETFLAEQVSADAEVYRGAAQGLIVEGELEIDANAVVSLCVEDGEATGAYVEAWVWVEGTGL